LSSTGGEGDFPTSGEGHGEVSRAFPFGVQFERERDCRQKACSINLGEPMERRMKIALVGAGMFGGDVHARAYADLQKAGISPRLGRVGLDHWARDFAHIKFHLVAVATRTEKSARRAQENFKTWTGREPKAYSGD